MVDEQYVPQYVAQGEVEGEPALAGPEAPARRSALLDRVLPLAPWALVLAAAVTTLGGVVRVYRVFVPDPATAGYVPATSTLSLDIGQALAPYAWSDTTPWAAIALLVLAVLGARGTFGPEVPASARRAATVVAAAVTLLGLVTVVTVAAWVGVTHGTVSLNSTDSSDPSFAGLGDFQVDPWMTLFGAGVPALTATVLGGVAVLALARTSAQRTPASRGSHTLPSRAAHTPSPVAPTLSRPVGSLAFGTLATGSLAADTAEAPSEGAWTARGSGPQPVGAAAVARRAGGGPAIPEADDPAAAGAGAGGSAAAGPGTGRHTGEAGAAPGVLDHTPFRRPGSALPPASTTGGAASSAEPGDTAGAAETVPADPFRRPGR